MAFAEWNFIRFVPAFKFGIVQLYGNWVEGLFISELDKFVLSNTDIFEQFVYG
jgi:hypothetical protein